MLKALLTDLLIVEKIDPMDLVNADDELTTSVTLTVSTTPCRFVFFGSDEEPRLLVNV